MVIHESFRSELLRIAPEIQVVMESPGVNHKVGALWNGSVTFQFSVFCCFVHTTVQNGRRKLSESLQNCSSQIRHHGLVCQRHFIALCDSNGFQEFSTYSVLYVFPESKDVDDAAHAYGCCNYASSNEIEAGKSCFKVCDPGCTVVCLTGSNTFVCVDLFNSNLVKL